MFQEIPRMICDGKISRTTRNSLSFLNVYYSICFINGSIQMFSDMYTINSVTNEIT